MSQIKELLTDLQGSDLHIMQGIPPMVRQNGQLCCIKDTAPLTEQICVKIAQELLLSLSKEQKSVLDNKKEVIFIYQGEQKKRYRVYLYWKDHQVKIHFRCLSVVIPDIEDLGFPQNIIEIAKYTEGLILIAGPMNSGRSTTAASLIKHWNNTRSINIITLERILEYQIPSNKSFIHQKEVYKNWLSIDNLLKQDIDAYFLADICDFHGYAYLMDVCQGGGLVLSTVLANNTIHVIEQLIDGVDDVMVKYFAHYLKAVIYQRLLPGKSGEPVLVSEILLPTLEIRKLIRNQDLDLIYDLIRKDQHRTGTTLFNQSLMNALIKRKIELRTAFSASPDPTELDQMLKKVGV